MENNLLEIFRNEVVEKLAKRLVDCEFVTLTDTLKKDLNNVCELLHASAIGGLIKKSEKENGTSAIRNLLIKGNHNGSKIHEMETIFSSEETIEDHRKLGNSLLAFIYDDEEGKGFEKIQHFLAGKYALKEEPLINLNRFVIPFSMGIIGRDVMDEDMEENEVKALLKSQAGYIYSQFPGLSKVMNLPYSSDEELERNEKEESTSDVVNDKETKNDSEDKPSEPEGEKVITLPTFIKNTIPWVVVLLISGFSLFGLQYFENKEVPKNKSSEDTNNPFDFIQNDSLTVKGLNSRGVINQNMARELKENPYLDELMPWIGDNELKDTVYFSDSQIDFVDSTSNFTLTSQKELGAILQILNTYDFLHLEMNLVSDSSYVNANKELIEDRLSHISNYFSVFGIDSSRISSDLVFQGPEKLEKPANISLPDSIKSGKLEKPGDRAGTQIYLSFRNQD
ncbi:DUF937 domain-containing protein [Membranihabitans maritimus]|uniref:DUF937 domain-containing protein n=1 Tax=Membranihabitans maritimus TaxID=2904244 RepID=UPI001F17A0E7|nr:DUF937 domain-containing protein [Membranihabitans maritimus]